MSQDVLSSPLQTCPDTPNCVHEAHVFHMLPSDLANLIPGVLQNMNAEHIDRGLVDAHEIHAVFKTWKFRDDMHLAIKLDDYGSSTLYVRSASRTGNSDLGVNKRRVRKFLRKLRASIEANHH